MRAQLIKDVVSYDILYYITVVTSSFLTATQGFSGVKTPHEVCGT